ncbi:hypothetical protein ACIBTV_27805 [Micromonospora sp. NPDC049366]
MERTDYENLSPRTLVERYNAAPYRVRLVILAELRRRGLAR